MKKLKNDSVNNFKGEKRISAQSKVQVFTLKTAHFTGPSLKPEKSKKLP